MLNCIVILLICCTTASGEEDVLQKYEISDMIGYESSYLLKGGRLTISCAASGGVKEVQVMNRTSGNKPVSKKGPYSELVMDLEAFHVDQRYVCEPAGAGGLFKIPFLHCNPFDMTPAAICQGNEKCMIEKTGKPKCRTMDENACFLSKFANIKSDFEASLPKLRIACVDLVTYTNNQETSYGLCHANAIKNIPVLGQAETIDQCTSVEFKEYTLNNKSIAQDTLFFETNADPKSWKLIHKENLLAECTVHSHDGKVIADFLTRNMNSVGPTTTSNLGSYKQPSKMIVHCNSSSSGGEYRAITTHMVLYDTNPSLYTVTIQEKADSKDGSIVLTCVCNVPEGFHCQLNWTKPDPIISSLEKIPSLAPKTIEPKELKTLRNETCYLQVWMYNHPAHTGLIKVPLNHEFKKSISISKKGDKPTGDKNNPSSENKTPNGNSSSLGGGAKDKENKSSKSTIIIVVVILICFLIASAVLALAVFWMRKNKKNRDIILQACAEQPIVVASAEQPKLDASAEQPKVIASADPPKVGASAEQPKYDETFINEIKKDKKHHVSMLTIDEISFSSGEINEAVEILKKNVKAFDEKDSEAYHAVLERYPDFKFLIEEYSDLQSLRKLLKCEEVGFIPTCRFSGQEILWQSWAFKGKKEANLFPSKKHPKTEGRLVPKSEISAEMKFGNATTLHCSWVTDIFCQKSYMLCQAPLMKEMILYLETLIQNKVGLIITLIAGEIPDTQTQIHCYYPYYRLDEGQTESYGKYRIKCLQILLGGEYYESRRVLISNTDKKAAQPPFSTTILSYKKWGDFKGVSDANHLVSIYASRKRLLSLEGTASQTTLIHCVAGLGRSGTLASCMNVLDYIEKEGFPINIFAIAAKLRSERVGAIQGLHQYFLIYLAVGQVIKKEFARAAPHLYEQKSTISKVNKLKYIPKKSSKRSSVSKQSSKK